MSVVRVPVVGGGVALLVALAVGRDDVRVSVQEKEEWNFKESSAVH